MHKPVGMGRFNDNEDNAVHRQKWENKMQPKIVTALNAMFLVVAIATHAQAQEFHVSPKGKDTNSGTKTEPFKTIARARDAVRGVNGRMTGDMVVYLHDGSHPLTETLTFDARDSGRNGYKVIYSAAPGSTPILTGGRVVAGWVLHDQAHNVYRAETVKEPFRQVYVDDALAVRARHPNRESTIDNSPYWKCKVPKKPLMRITTEYWNACTKVPKAKLAEVEMVMISHWYHQRVRVGTVTILGDAVEITPATPNSNFTKDQAFYGRNGIFDNPFYFENAQEFIDTPYEWYQDLGAGILYMAFPKEAKPDKVRVEIPVLETLIAVEGTAAAAVQNLEFRGLTFKLTNWNKPSTFGINMTQAAQAQGCESPSAMLRAKHVQRVAFRNNVFCNAGGQGLELYNADLTDIEGNTFRAIAANGIVIDMGTGGNPSSDKQSVGIAIWNNEATTCGSHYSNGMFLFASNVRELIVAHNHIHDLPYSGMQIGQQPGGIRGKEYRDVGCGGNRILNNHIHHCTQIHGDGGGIYTLGGIQTGTVISGNYVHDTNQPKWDNYHVTHIYLDNNSSKITVKDNVTKGGKAEERNGSKGNVLSNNTELNPEIEKNAGIKPGYSPR
jgi:hypothetical protein